MERVRVLSEVRAMRFEEVLDRRRSGRLSCEEAADVLGKSVSSFFRWRRRFEAGGAEGLADKRVGKASARRAPVDEVTKVLELFETRYHAFNVRHFHEKLVAEHGVRRSCMWTKATLQAAGAVEKDNPTQVHRALTQLGISLIPAYSPEARGRSERMFETLQGRLPQELRLAEITGMEAANRFLAEVFLPAHNARFADPPRGARQGLRAVERRRSRRHPVRPGGTHRRQRQHRAP